MGVGAALKAETPSVPYKYTHRYLASSHVCLFISHSHAGIAQVLALIREEAEVGIHLVQEGEGGS